MIFINTIGELKSVTIGSSTYKVKYSDFVIELMKKYNLNDIFISGQIFVFGKNLLDKFKDSRISFQVVDKDEGLSFIFRFIDDYIVLVDIIEENNIYISDGLDFFKV